MGLWLYPERRGHRRYWSGGESCRRPLALLRAGHGCVRASTACCSRIQEIGDKDTSAVSGGSAEGMLRTAGRQRRKSPRILLVLRLPNGLKFALFDSSNRFKCLSSATIEATSLSCSDSNPHFRRSPRQGKSQAARNGAGSQPTMCNACWPARNLLDLRGGAQAWLRVNL